MTFHVASRRIDAHSSLSSCKNAEIALETDEVWQPLAEGDLVAVRQGALLATRDAVTIAGTPSAMQ